MYFVEVAEVVLALNDTDVFKVQSILLNLDLVKWMRPREDGNTLVGFEDGSTIVLEGAAKEIFPTLRDQ